MAHEVMQFILFDFVVELLRKNCPNAVVGCSASLGAETLHSSFSNELSAGQGRPSKLGYLGCRLNATVHIIRIDHHETVAAPLEKGVVLIVVPSCDYRFLKWLVRWDRFERQLDLQKHVASDTSFVQQRAHQVVGVVAVDTRLEAQFFDDGMLKQGSRPAGKHR